MGTLFKGWAVVMLVLAVVVFSIGGLSLAVKGTFLPWEESIRREVFEETKSYVHGTIRDLENLRLEYSRAENEGHKNVLRSTILHRIATFDQDKLPDDLRVFVENLRTEEENR